MPSSMFTYERQRDKVYFYGPKGGSVDVEVLIYVDEEIPGATLSLAHDIRAEHADFPLYELSVTPSEFYRARRDHSTWNTQLDPVHLWALQNGVELSVPASELRTLSLDIECISASGAFPNALVDPVLSLSIASSEGGDGWVLSLGSSAPSSTLQPPSVCFRHEEFVSEVDLLLRFCELVREVDPDYITGWNVLNFDLEYIATRAKLLKVPLNIGRNGSQPRQWDKETHTRAHGTRITKMFDVWGRIVFDSMAVYQKILNEPSYKLQNIAMKYLDEGKDDMPYSEIWGCMQTPEGRLRVARYCYKDALLVLRILKRLRTLERFSGLASVTGAPLKKIINGGQQVRCFSALLKENFEANLGFAFPNIEMEPNDGYEGATVITPDIGATTKTIATLDFAALYPSIMVACNICWSTIQTMRPIAPYPLTQCPYLDVEGTIRRYHSIKDGIVHGGEIGFDQTTQGLVPRVEAKLYQKRKEVKREMKGATGEEYDILNAYQLALKLVMNSMYGLLGAKVGYMPDVRLAEFITGTGRMFIEWTRVQVERETGLSVCGGDTDSVFVKYNRAEPPSDSPSSTGGRSVSDWHAYWEVLAANITATYGHPAMNLEYEKMYLGEPNCLSWLLVAKKRYAGYKWDAGADHGKLTYTGLECKRRDFCEYVREAMKTLLLQLFTVGVDTALRTLEETVRAHILGETPIDGFLLSKQYFKKAEEYKVKGPHVLVALRTHEQVGSRIPYYICWRTIHTHAPTNATNVAERAFSPAEVQAGDLPLDYIWYYRSQFKKPLKRITDCVQLNAPLWTRLDAYLERHMRGAIKRKRDAAGFKRLFP